MKNKTKGTGFGRLIRRSLTAGVFESADGVGQESHATQETSALLLVDLLMVPYTDSDRVRFPDVSKSTSEEKNLIQISSLMFLTRNEISLLCIIIIK